MTLRKREYIIFEYFAIIWVILQADVLSDDLLGEVNGAGRKVSEGVLTGKDNGDGDSTYELYAYITHNCGGEGKTRRIEMEPMCEVGIARCGYILNAKL